MKYGRPVVTKNNMSAPRTVTINNDKNKNVSKQSAKVEVRKPQRPTPSSVKAPFQTNPSIPFPKKSTSITHTAPKTRPQSASRYKQPVKNTAGANTKKTSQPSALGKKSSQSEKSGYREHSGQLITCDKDSSGREDHKLNNSDSHDHVTEYISTTEEEFSSREANFQRGDNLDCKTYLNRAENSSQNGMHPKTTLESSIEQTEIKDEKPEKKKFSLLTDG